MPSEVPIGCPYCKDEFRLRDVAGGETMPGRNRASDRIVVASGKVNFKIREGFLFHHCNVVLRIHDNRELADGRAASESALTYSFN